MNDKDISRRQFVAVTSTLLAAGTLPGIAFGAETAGEGALALEGGPRAVKQPLPHPVRWGNPEREQLNAALEQKSLLYWKGPQTELLSKRFRERYPLKYVMNCSSGTAAIHIAVAAAGIGPGDEVITTPITDIGTVIGILFQQGVPVFADLNAHDYNLDPADVERKITPKTKAIIAVHLAGNPSRLEELRALADKHSLILIEDCAQAWGALYRGKPVGTIGHVACFSLQDSKLITSGEGGVVASNDEHIGPGLQPFGDKGTHRTDAHIPTSVLATNYRMSELQAAFAAAQMERLEKIAARRAALGNLLSEIIGVLPGIKAHAVDSQDRCSYWFYLFRMQPGKFRCDRAQFVKALNAEGVTVGAGYIPELLFEKQVFQKHAFFAGRWPVKEMGLTTMDYTKTVCPEASAILKDSIIFRVNEAMHEEYIRDIGEGIRKVAKHYAV